MPLLSSSSAAQIFFLWWFVYGWFRGGEWVVRLHEMRIFVARCVGLIY